MFLTLFTLLGHPSEGESMETKDRTFSWELDLKCEDTRSPMILLPNKATAKSSEANSVLEATVARATSKDGKRNTRAK